MPKVIEVYVRKIEVLGQSTYTGRPIVAGYGGHWCTVYETHQIMSGMSESDQAALAIARRVGEEKGLRIRVYDLSKMSSKIRARLKGVKRTPTIVFGDKNLEGVPAEERLLSIIQ